MLIQLGGFVVNAVAVVLTGWESGVMAPVILIFNS